MSDPTITAPDDYFDWDDLEGIEPEPETPNGIIVDELDGTKRAATDEEAKDWADQTVDRGILTEDHPSVILARTGVRTGFLL